MRHIKGQNLCCGLMKFFIGTVLLYPVNHLCNSAPICLYCKAVDGEQIKSTMFFKNADLFQFI